MPATTKVQTRYKIVKDITSYDKYGAYNDYKTIAEYINKPTRKLKKGERICRITRYRESDYNADPRLAFPSAHGLCISDK